MIRDYIHWKEKEYSELKAKNDEMTAKFDREKGAILKLK